MRKDAPFMVLLATVEGAAAGASGVGGGPGSGLGTGVVLMVVGMSVVFAALTVLLGVVALLGCVLRDRDVVERGGVPGGEASTPGVAGADGLSSELVAVLTAAAVAVMRKPVRIRRITVVGQAGGSAWLAGGRSSLMGSHKPTRRRE